MAKLETARQQENKSWRNHGNFPGASTASVYRVPDADPTIAEQAARNIAAASPAPETPTLPKAASPATAQPSSPPPKKASPTPSKSKSKAKAPTISRADKAAQRAAERVINETVKAARVEAGDFGQRADGANRTRAKNRYENFISGNLPLIGDKKLFMKAY